MRFEYFWIKINPQWKNSLRDFFLLDFFCNYRFRFFWVREGGREGRGGERGGTVTHVTRFRAVRWQMLWSEKLMRCSCRVPDHMGTPWKFLVDRFFTQCLVVRREEQEQEQEQEKEQEKKKKKKKREKERWEKKKEMREGERAGKRKRESVSSFTTHHTQHHMYTHNPHTTHATCTHKTPHTTHTHHHNTHTHHQHHTQHHMYTHNPHTTHAICTHKTQHTTHQTTQHNTTQHNTTQHNTTQHSTAQHSTAQHNPTVILRVSVQSKRKMNAWICSRTTDHDPANVIFNVICNICNVCNFVRIYCFGINFIFATVFIFGEMVLRCLVMQTLLDATSWENLQWEVLRCGVANSWKRGPRLWESWPWAVESPNWQQWWGQQPKVWDCIQFWTTSVCVAMWQSNLTRPQQFGWSTDPDWEKSDIWLLETCGCNTMLVQGKFEFPKCQDWRIRAMHKPSVLGRNHCCATRKLAIGSLSLMMASRDECRWVALCRGVDFNLFRTPRCMDTSGQEDCDEWTKLKICPGVRDAWTNLVKRVVVNERNSKICMHGQNWSKGRDEWTKLKICPEDLDAWTWDSKKNRNLQHSDDV